MQVRRAMMCASCDIVVQVERSIEQHSAAPAMTDSISVQGFLNTHILVVAVLPLPQVPVS